MTSSSRSALAAAPRRRGGAGMWSLLAALLWSAGLPAATFKTENFVVTAPSDDVARQVGRAAEFHRSELALAWLGEELPKWYRPCPIKVKVGQYGAGGATTFTFEGGEVFGWNMNVQGSLERILDSVIPHEVSHTIFASHFRSPLPRWADEGAATLVEHESERLRQTKLLNQVVNTSRRIPLQKLLEITEYPQDMQDVLTLYAEGYSLADFLVQQKGAAGRAVYLEFLGDSLEHDWTYAFKKHYGYADLRAVEKDWSGWVLAGSPLLPTSDDVQLADASTSAPRPGRQQPRPEQPQRQPSRGEQQLASAAAEQGRYATGESLVRGQSPQSLAPLARTNRALRTRPHGRVLDAPEPSVTAMPQGPATPWENAGDDFSRDKSRDAEQVAVEGLPPDRGRTPQQWNNQPAQSRNGDRTVPRPLSGYPPSRNLRRNQADTAFTP